MKTTTGQITLGNKTYKSTEVDYEFYGYKNDAIALGNSTFTARLAYGLQLIPRSWYDESEFDIDSWS